MKQALNIGVVLIMSSMLTCVHAESSQTDRYVSVTSAPRKEQVNLLLQTVQLRFPQHIQTIGQAIHYLLRYSGYSLIAENQMTKAFKTTMSMPLPFVDRELGPVSLSVGLLILAGPAFNLEHDPINRTINFRLKAAYVKGHDRKAIHQHFICKRG